MATKTQMVNDPDVQKAAQLLQEVEQQKVELCAAEIYEILQKYECGMIPEMLFRGAKLLPQVLIVTQSGVAAPLRPLKQMQQPLDK